MDCVAHIYPSGEGWRRYSLNLWKERRWLMIYVYVRTVTEGGRAKSYVLRVFKELTAHFLGVCVRISKKLLLC
jgi:hypothetical protein